MVPLCLAKPARRVSMGRPVARQMISNQNLRVSWKPVNATRLRMERISTKLSCWTTMQEHGDNSLQHYNLVHKIYSYASKPWRWPAAKAAVDEEWEILEKIPAWDLTKVRSKSEVIDEARTKGAKVHFASLMDMLFFLKNAELETRHKKYKGRVVLRGDIVKDASGSCAVLNEQGSSASQMTAAKVTEIISRQPGCSGPAAGAVSACTQIKMEDAPKLFKNSQIGMSRHLDSSTTTQMAQIMVHVWKTRSFLLSGICTVVFWQDRYGKGNLRTSCWSTVGRRFPFGNAYSYTLKKGNSFLCMWMT